MKELTRTSIVAIPFLVMAAIIYLLTKNPFIYDKHADDQEFKKFIAVTTEWQTIAFDSPLKINRKEIQCLRIGIRYEKYESAYGFVAQRNWDTGANESTTAVGEYIVRLSDEKFILPELELIDGDGNAVRLKHSGIAGLPTDEFLMEYSMHYKSNFDPIPPYPGTSLYFKSMRIRASEPFEVVYVDWWAAGV